MSHGGAAGAKETNAFPTHHASLEGSGLRDRLPVAVIGAGPVGLAAAVHLLERGERPLILEAGEFPGSTVRTWAHVRMFSPWRTLVDPVAGAALEARGWSPPDPDGVPTGAELVEAYLDPLAALPGVRDVLRTGRRVAHVGRSGLDKLNGLAREAAPFELVVERGGGRASPTGKGSELWDGGSHGAAGRLAERHLAKAVIDASGTFHRPNPLGDKGLSAEGEEELADRIVYGIPDPRHSDGFAGRRTAVVGNGDTALNALLALAELVREDPETRITWVVRGEPVDDRSETVPTDALPERTRLRRRAHALLHEGVVELVKGFAVRTLREEDGGAVLERDEDLGGANHPQGSAALGPFHRVVAATGSRPDLEMLRELWLDLDPRLECPARLAPLVDTELHSCETVEPHGYHELRQPEPGFFLLGLKSYGRAPGFLLTTGYEQVRSVVSALVGDMEGAKVDPGSVRTGGACSAPAAQVPAEVDGPRGVELGPAPSGSAGCCG